MNNKILALLTAVVFASGAVTGATAATGEVPIVGSSDQPTTDDSTHQPTANITEVDVDGEEFTVYSDSEATTYIRVWEADTDSGIHDTYVSPAASAHSFPLNYSYLGSQKCGYNVDGDTRIEALDDEFNTLDETTLNISAQTEVCK